ncbi:hypothetical protein BD770DRAFT_440799 [Pilaira anomala]|nr:hypothetical protein BD770DRAFT_440799 [Pilaira anomala]
MTSSIQQDFPIAFAEQVNNHSSSDVEIYVEWLDNSIEFPTLLSSSAVHATQLDGDNWELLQRKEVTEDDENRHILVPLEEDDEWLNTEFEKKEVLYSEVTEKNAAELQPKQRTVVTSVWVNKDKWKDVSTIQKEEENDDDDYEDDEDDIDLLEVSKSNSRRANRLSRLRRFRGLKTVDNNYGEGYYKVMTTKGLLMKPPAAAAAAAPGTEINGKVRTRGGDHHGARSDKKNVLGLCSSKYNHHKMNKYTFKYLHAVPKTSTKDNSEFSVHSDIILK